MVGNCRLKNLVNSRCEWETFEDLMKIRSIPCHYFCWRSFDIVYPSAQPRTSWEACTGQYHHRVLLTIIRTHEHLQGKGDDIQCTNSPARQCPDFLHVRIWPGWRSHSNMGNNNQGLLLLQLFEKGEVYGNPQYHHFSRLAEEGHHGREDLTVGPVDSRGI